VSERPRGDARSAARGDSGAGGASGKPTAKKPAQPAALGTAITDYLRQSGLAERVSQAGVIPEWPQLVGPQVAAVTQPICVTADGTLFVAVATNPWMAELSLMERQLLAAINVVAGRTPVKKIRWQARG
jgi:predicted nucleic acid-binding Zn ribbon protein